MSLSPRQRESMSAGFAEIEGEEELDVLLEKLMVSRDAKALPVFAAAYRLAIQDDLGMKESAREAMRKMPEENKRKLIDSHRPSTTKPAPIRPSKTGPHGGLASIKRFSLASVGWGTSPVELLSQDISQSPEGLPETSEDGLSTLAELTATPDHRTPSSWTSWWSVASTMTGSTQISEEAKDTPSFYVDQLLSA